MTKKNLVLSCLVLFIACKPNKVTHSAADTARAKSSSTAGNSAPATGLTGIWAKENDDNPAFEINQDSVFYPDHAASYPYETTSDSILIHYKGFTDTFKAQLKGNDTLVLSNKLNGKRIYYRYKN